MPTSSASAVSDFAPSRARYTSSVMPKRLAYLNDAAQEQCLGWRNDFSDGLGYHWAMAFPRHDWYLKQWLRASNKKQADLERDLELNKAKVSLTANGKQPYDRELINAIADYLNVRPYELLMHPDDAMAIRQLQASAERIVTIVHDAELAAKKRGADPSEAVLGRTGTEG